jgi:hypothetical protein
MTDDIFPNYPTGPKDVTRDQAEAEDVASTQRELLEQERISAEQSEPFGHNRVVIERTPA